MNAKEIREKLQTVKNNYALTQAGILFLAQPETPLKFEEYFSVIAEHPESESFGYIRYLLHDDALLKHGVTQLRKSVLRGCLKETYELIKLYSEETNQNNILKAAPWYQFLRVIRNSLSHNFCLVFNKYDKSVLPVSWGGLTIDINMDGNELPMAGFLTIENSLKLIDEVCLYVENNYG